MGERKARRNVFLQILSQSGFAERAEGAWMLCEKRDFLSVGCEFFSL